VLLLDEPLSNLDAALRLEMRHEIRRLCTETGITTLYVTHDQAEALSMADGVAVLRDGHIEQIGGPRELYDRPRSRFVAGFLGETNLVRAKVAARQDGRITLDSTAGRLVSSAIPPTPPAQGDEVTCSIRPESLRFADAGGGDADALEGDVKETTFLGATAQSVVELKGGVQVKVSELNPGMTARSGKVRLTIDPADVVLVED
jgi:iron(III) transport system ATP-binding protein